MIREQGGLLNFLRGFEECMASDLLWNHKCRNRPRFDDLLYVYIIICNQVRYRCYYGGYDTGPMKAFTMDGRNIITDWPRIILAGPVVKSPSKIYKRGFQGFRYCEQLF